MPHITASSQLASAIREVYINADSMSVSADEVVRKLNRAYTFGGELARGGKVSQRTLRIAVEMFLERELADYEQEDQYADTVLDKAESLLEGLKTISDAEFTSDDLSVFKSLDLARFNRLFRSMAPNILDILHDIEDTLPDKPVEEDEES